MEELRGVVEDFLQQKIVRYERVGGGCISEAYLLHLEKLKKEAESSSRESVFLKHNSGHYPHMFEREAQGLLALRDASSAQLGVPHPLHYGDHFLLMEAISPGHKNKEFYVRLGDELARLHQQVTGASFGFGQDNYLGATLQKNERSRHWGDFFWERRLMFQLDLLSENKRPAGEIAARLRPLKDKIIELLEEHGPRPSLLHGDLWSGNVYAGKGGVPYLIDPAVYYGDRESDLAMTSLFGGFPQDFYEAYERRFPLPANHQKRRLIYQLYHVLNHINLFGGHYSAQALRLIDDINDIDDIAKF